jgi:hypothetical protein
MTKATNRKAAMAKSSKRVARVGKAGPASLARRKGPAPMVWDVVAKPVPPVLVLEEPPKSRLQSRRAVGPMVISAVVVLALAVLGVATQVTSQGNTGTIKVHDGPTADPETRNEPHVSGDFYIEGFNMAADSGGLFFFSWPPTGNRELVRETTWEADDGEPAFHFLAGPFELPCGHYRVAASNGPAEPEDFPGGMKHKAFWVDDCAEPEPPECGEPGAPPCPEEPECGEPGAPPCPEEPECGEPGAPPCPGPEPEMVCPTGLLAIANGDGSVRLTWTEAPGSDGTNVYRADGDGDFVYVTTTAAGSDEYLDTTTVAGASYAYMVTGLYGNEESVGCALVEVTAIPDLPTALGAGLAMGGSLVAFALLARRRKA